MLFKPAADCGILLASAAEIVTPNSELRNFTNTMVVSLIAWDAPREDSCLNVMPAEAQLKEECSRLWANNSMKHVSPAACAVLRSPMALSGKILALLTAKLTTTTNLEFDVLVVAVSSPQTRLLRLWVNSGTRNTLFALDAESASLTVNSTKKMANPSARTTITLLPAPFALNATDLSQEP